jgi:hypothetical protein
MWSLPFLRVMLVQKVSVREMLSSLALTLAQQGKRKAPAPLYTSPYPYCRDRRSLLVPKKPTIESPAPHLPLPLHWRSSYLLQQPILERENPGPYRLQI